MTDIVELLRLGSIDDDLLSNAKEAADLIERLRAEIAAMTKALEGPNLAWERMSETNVRLVDQMAVLTTEIDALRAELAALKARHE